MNIDRPTVELYFVFAFTYCKLRVYIKDEEFVREILADAGLQEWLEPDASKEWQEIDTRVLLDLTRTALPKMLKRRMEKIPAPAF